MWRFVIRGLCFSLLPALPVLSNAKEISDFSANPDLPSEVVASGFEFLTPESQALQLDDFANPGFLWVDRGRLLFEKQEGKRACVDCHSERDSEMDSEMDSRREGMAAIRATSLSADIAASGLLELSPGSNKRDKWNFG